MEETIVNQRYKFSIKDVLGKGSFATVYKGQDIVTKDAVAVKVINQKTLQRQGPDAIGLVNREIKILQKLSSLNIQNIVKIYDCSKQNDFIYIIMELCDQGTLDNILQKKDILTEKEALKILYQILSVLVKLADFNISHRDLKPENIFVKNRLYKLGDFGFATEKKMMTTQLGTFPFMAPELFSEEKDTYSNKVDVWSLGVVYHQMLTGQMYFVGKSHFDVQDKILKKEYIPPTNISDESKDALNQMLKKNPEQRISAKDLWNHKIFKKFEDDILSQYNTFESEIFRPMDIFQNFQQQSKNDTNSAGDIQSQQQQQQKTVVIPEPFYNKVASAQNIIYNRTNSGDQQQPVKPQLLTFKDKRYSHEQIQQNLMIQQEFEKQANNIISFGVQRRQTLPVNMEQMYNFHMGRYGYNSPQFNNFNIYQGGQQYPQASFGNWSNSPSPQHFNIPPQNLQYMSPTIIRDKFKRYSNMIIFMTDFSKKLQSTQDIEQTLASNLLLKKCQYNLKEILTKIQLNENIGDKYLNLSIDLQSWNVFINSDFKEQASQAFIKQKKSILQIIQEVTQQLNQLISKDNQKNILVEKYLTHVQNTNDIDTINAVQECMTELCKKLTQIQSTNNLGLAIECYLTTFIDEYWIIDFDFKKFKNDIQNLTKLELINILKCKDFKSLGYMRN